MINQFTSVRKVVYRARKEKNPPRASYVHTAEALQPAVLGQEPSERGRALMPRQPGEGKTSHFVKKSQYQARKSVANYFKQLVLGFFFINGNTVRFSWRFRSRWQTIGGVGCVYLYGGVSFPLAAIYVSEVKVKVRNLIRQLFIFLWRLTVLGLGCNNHSSALKMVL